MTYAIRSLILRVNSLYLMAASIGGVVMDISGIYFNFGPEARIVHLAPHAGLGFLEAHLLALIISLGLWRTDATVYWHLIGGATVAMLGICNLLFWDIFIAAQAVAMGYLSTSFHLLIALLQFAAAITSQGTHTRAQAA